MNVFSKMRVICSLFEDDKEYLLNLSEISYNMASECAELREIESYTEKEIVPVREMAKGGAKTLFQLDEQQRKLFADKKMLQRRLRTNEQVLHQVQPKLQKKY